MNTTHRASLPLTLAAGLVLSIAPTVVAQSTPRGSLAPIGAKGTAAGWAHAHTQRSVRVYFSIDARVTELPSLSVLASERRDDVKRVEQVAGDHGFRYTIPTRYRDGRSHVLYAYVRDARTGRLIDLAGSPRHFHLFTRQAPKVPARWYEDNNLASEVGVPDDFVARYASNRLASWERARGTMDVFMLRSSIFNRHLLGKPELQRRFVAAHRGTPIALDDTSATWAHYLNPKPTYAGGMFVLQTLKRLGADVRYVALQSVLDKPTPDGRFYPMTQRVQDVVQYVKIAKGRWPNLQIGLIDAMPTHGRSDWATAYVMLRNELRKVGHALDFLILDMPMPWATKPGMLDRLMMVKRFVKTTVKWRFGWTVSMGLPGARTNAEYRTKLLAGLAAYQRKGGGADFVAVMSWSKAPRLSAPDSISIKNPTTTSMFREVDHRLPR